MPQQHPGRLQVLVVDTHCKRKLFSTKTQTDPDELARRFCTPDTRHTQYTLWDKGVFSGQLPVSTGSH
ncbi:PilI type IV pilus biogenesis protein, partial [Escherichia coli]